MPRSCCSCPPGFILPITSCTMVQAIASVSGSREPKKRRIRICLPEEAERRSPPSADGSFSFLCRAQEATELLPEDLLQVRHGLGWQACACLCLGVGTCPVPACDLRCRHVQVTELGSASLPGSDSRTMALREWQAPATGKGFPGCSQRDGS